MVKGHFYWHCSCPVPSLPLGEGVWILGIHAKFTHLAQKYNPFLVFHPEEVLYPGLNVRFFYLTVVKSRCLWASESPNLLPIFNLSNNEYYEFGYTPVS